MAESLNWASWSKLWGVESGAITEGDVIRNIKTVKPLDARYEVIDVENKRMVRNIVKELDDDQAVVLVEAQAEDGRIVKETLVTGSDVVGLVSGENCLGEYASSQWTLLVRYTGRTAWKGVLDTLSYTVG